MSQTYVDKAAHVPGPRRQPCQFLALQRGSFMAKGDGGGKLKWFAKSKPLDMKKVVSQQLEKRYPEYHCRLNNVKLSTADYRKTMREHDSKDTFFFLDPPYPQKVVHYHDYQQGIPTPEELSKTLGSLKGKFLMTYPPAYRKHFARRPFRTRTISVPLMHPWISHDLQRTERTRKEMLVTNYDLGKVPGCR